MLSGNGKTLFVGGPAGPPNTLAIGTVATGAAGSQAQATVTGASPVQSLNLVIPKGDLGATGAVPWAPITAWYSGQICTATAPATLVYVGGTAYVCAISHIAGTFATDLAAGRWAQIAPGGLQPWKTQPQPWAASTAYSASAPADVVTNGGGCYVCSTSHTSGPSFDATKWTQIASPGQATGALLTANNLSELAANPGPAQSNLGIAFAARRQTVLAGPASGGVPTFVPTSAASLTLAFQNLSGASPLIITAAAAFGGVVGDVDLVAQVTNNPSLTLAASATNFGFYDFVSAAVPSAGPGSGTLAPIYQFGGTIATTNGQFTFDIQAMQGWLGNGSAAVKCNRVYLFEAVTSASAVTSVTPYAYRGVYQSGVQSTTAGGVVTFAHNIGVPVEMLDMTGYARASGGGNPWAPNPLAYASTSYQSLGVLGGVSRLQIKMQCGSNGVFIDNGSGTGSTATSVDFMVRARRSF